MFLIATDLAGRMVAASSRISTAHPFGSFDTCTLGCRCL